MELYSGNNYLTRCGLTVKVKEKINDPRDRFPVVGEFQNGIQQGLSDFWMTDGRFFENTEHALDLVSLA